ncbi:MAG TPA: HDOD domain-containing protein [Nannocystaceae bacterium]|nr:HDOD domain-containing protein [Nannocystaceae bacterium]
MSKGAPRRSLFDPIAVELSDEEAGRLTERRSDRVRAAAEKLLDATGVDTRMPMLPETASEVLALANDPGAPMNRLERVVAADAMLASRVLMVASSAAYAGTPVRTLGNALQRLGVGTVRDILYQSVLECHVFSAVDREWAMHERDHAVAVATVSRTVCRLARVELDLAFVCGLLHDLGRVVARSGAAQIEPAIRREVEHLVHTRLGSRIAGKWNLPQLVRDAMRRHHGFRGFGRAGDGYSQIGHIVAAADVVCVHLGFGRPVEALDQTAQGVIWALGLDPAQLVSAARCDLGRGVTQAA